VKYILNEYQDKLLVGQDLQKQYRMKHRRFNTLWKMTLKYI